MKTRWILGALAASLGAFALAMIACASRDWHKPNDTAIYVILIGAFVSGVVLAYRRFATLAEPFDLDGRTSTRAVRPRAPATAIALAALFTLSFTFAVVLWLGEWSSLFGASLVGSVWMATIPLHPVAAWKLVEQKLEVGFDAIAIERLVLSRTIDLRDVAGASATMRLVTIRLRDGSTIRLVAASERIASVFATSIHGRAAPIEIPAALRREGRTLDAWRAALASPDYRKSTISADAAERVLRAGCATPDERIGAAIVLVSLGEHERVSRARRAYVRAPMSIALDRVIDGTLDDACIQWTERHA